MASTVLIVDDLVDFRAVARVMLEAGGYRVVGEAGTGADGLGEAARLGPDIVLLDVRLPDIDGFAVCRELRTRMPTVKVVLCSARDATDYGSRITDCGACGFLLKSELSSTALTRLVTGCR
ncbi:MULTISPECIES: response regulator transcription factor [unclassified Frankia]|uniref:response regulator transcription factor n=1 Tax=unclassified Frankia TaxID=2632575 RepID=UPI002024279A